MVQSTCNGHLKINYAVISSADGAPRETDDTDEGVALSTNAVKGVEIISKFAVRLDPPSMIEVASTSNGPEAMVNPHNSRRFGRRRFDTVRGCVLHYMTKDVQMLLIRMEMQPKLPT